MSVLAKRMDLMDLYGLRLEEKELFGKERGDTSVGFKKECMNTPRGGRSLKELPPKPEKQAVSSNGFICYTDKFKKKVVLAALKATADFKPFQSGRDAVLKKIAKKYKIGVNTVRKWMKDGYHR